MNKKLIKWSPLSIYSVLALMSIFVLFPFIWMFFTSLKTEVEALQLPITWIPEQPTVKSYVEMWTIKPFAVYFMNSIIISGSTAILSTMLGALAGYGFSRFLFKGRRFLIGAFLATQMISGVLLIGPYFKMMSRFGLYNTRTSLIIAFIAISLPFCSWMMKGFFDTLSKDLEESAMIDGCSRLQAVFRISMPLAVPGMVATFMFAFLLSWQDLLWSMCLTSTDSVRPVTLGIAFLVGEFRIRWPMLTAASIMGSTPSIILYAFLQKSLVQGLTAGAVKE